MTARITDPDEEQPKGSMRDFYHSLIRKPRSEWDEEDRQNEADARDHEVVNHECEEL